VKRDKAAKLKQTFLKEIKANDQVLKAAILGTIYICNSVKKIKEWLDGLGIESIRIWKRNRKYVYYEIKTKEGLIYIPLKELDNEMINNFASIQIILRVHNLCRDIGAYGVRVK